MMTSKPLPALHDKAPGVNGFKYKPQFGVIVVCKDEEHHKTVLASLQAQGHKCKAVRV